MIAWLTNVHVTLSAVKVITFADTFYDKLSHVISIYLSWCLSMRHTQNGVVAGLLEVGLKSYDNETNVFKCGWKESLELSSSPNIKATGRHIILVDVGAWALVHQGARCLIEESHRLENAEFRVFTNSRSFIRN